MRKYEGILLCTDYDGTLAGSDGLISQENRTAIEHFKSEGGMFTVASGRTPAFILDKCKGCLPNAPVIAINGGMITDMNGQTILMRSILGDEILDVTDELVHLTGFTGIIEMWAGEMEVFSWDGRRGRNPSEKLSEAKGCRYKTVIMHPDEQSAIEMRDIGRKQFGSSFRFERSWPVGLEILPLSGGKGTAVRKLRQLCRDKIHTIVCAGDFENDASMIREADIGYAVANAVDDVLNAADRITVRNTEHAIQRIVEEL